jgi:NodT family efflux transporter outer membrane factor (OMF) lipoprotein
MRDQMMMKYMLPLLLGTSTLSACAAGPDYVRPSTPSSAAQPFLGGASPAVARSTPNDRWWTLYRDPLLNRLVDDALAANTDLRVAVARIERARASVRGAGADRLPQTTIGSSANYARTSAARTLPGVERENWTFDGGLDVSYEVDLFGRVKRGVEAARGDLGAAEADAAGVRLAIVADTVQAYLDVTTSAERLAVAQRTVALLDQGIRITGARFDVGRSDRLDVIRITGLRDQQKANIPTLLADRDAAFFRLATLTGRTPQDLPVDVRASVATPDLIQPIPVGDGALLLARRPDVRAAERRLAADTARIGVATADLYPRISLGGSVGTTALGGNPLLGAGPLRWLLGPLISWAFPNSEGVRARIAGARADSAAALATFDGTVLRALEETETALSVYTHAIQRAQMLSDARDAASRAASITRARQREGRIDFLTVLDAQRTLADAEAELVAGRRSVAFAQVGLFRVLGGGWTVS